MHRNLGADSKEYGPVNGEVLRQGITQDRTNAQTKVKPAGSATWSGYFLRITVRKDYYV